jgi:hypothetical protein
VHDAPAIRRWQRHEAIAARRLTVLALAVRDGDPIAPIRRAPDDLEPAVLVAEVDE